MSTRLVTIVAGAITVVELGIVVVQVTMCKPPAPVAIQTDATDLTIPTAAPVPAIKRVELGDLVEATLDRTYLSGKADVPGNWPEGFEPLDVVGGLDGAVRITSGERSIQLIETRFHPQKHFDLTIRAGNALDVEYRTGKLACSMLPERGAVLRTIEVQPPVAELRLAEHVRGGPTDPHEYLASASSYRRSMSRARPKRRSSESSMPFSSTPRSSPSFAGPRRSRVSSSEPRSTTSSRT